MPPEEKQDAKGTSYAVLKQVAPDDAANKGDWREIGTTVANTKPDAVKAVAKNKAGDYKAVPLRSWRDTVKVEVEQVTKVTAEVV